MLKLNPTTEMLVMCTFGLVFTIYESSVQSMNENIKDVWALEFPSNAVIGTESIVKSIMIAVALARGLTVHVYIASYLLMFFPILFGQGLSLLLIWMLICALRSVVVNLVTLLTGFLICAAHSELKQVCFEFGAAKAVEIACSVFMWLSVNDFYIRLRNERRRNALASRMSTKMTQITDSDLSLVSSSDLSDFLDMEDDNCDSEDSIMVRAAVDWLMRMAFGVKYENRKMELDNAKAQRFLNMSLDELRELQNRIHDQLLGENVVRNQNVITNISMLDEDAAVTNVQTSSQCYRIENKISITERHRNRSLTQSSGSQTKEREPQRIQERLSNHNKVIQNSDKSMIGIDHGNSTMKANSTELPSAAPLALDLQGATSIQRLQSSIRLAGNASPQTEPSGNSSPITHSIPFINETKSTAETVQDTLLQKNLVHKNEKDEEKSLKLEMAKLRKVPDLADSGRKMAPKQEAPGMENHPPKNVTFKRKPGF